MKKYTNLPYPVILSALKAVESFVKPTYGPAGRGILIDKEYEQTIVDDGFAALEQLELKDELENAVLLYMRDATRKTNKRAGDGTTTATLVVVALVSAALGTEQTALKRFQPNTLCKEIEAAAKKAVAAIRDASEKVTTVEQLIAIARSAYDNEEMANIVGKMVYELGPEGVISVDTHDLLESESEVVTGLSFDRGFISPFMALPNGSEVELKDTHILITDYTIEKITDILPILEKVQAEGKKQILIIAENVGGAALTVFTVNSVQGNFNTVAIRMPGFGDEKFDTLEDIAIVTGGTVISTKTSRTLESATLADLGRAKQVKVTQGKTVIISGAGEKKDVDARVAILKERTVEGEYEKHRLQVRVAQLTGGVGQIRVGASTENEAKAVQMKVDDAVHATQLAYKEGTIPGAGTFLAALQTGSETFDKALKVPRAVLEENGADALSDDVRDATGVVVASIESAASIATQLIKAGGIIAREREKEKKQDDV